MSWTDLTQLSDLMAWYKPSSLSSYTTGAAINSWADSSGNGIDLEQSTSASQPTKLATAIGSYAGAQFDGVDDFMSTQTTQFSLTAGQNVAYTAALQLDSLTTYNGLFSFDNAATLTYPGEPLHTWVYQARYVLLYNKTARNDGYLFQRSTPGPENVVVNASTSYIITFGIFHNSFCIHRKNGDSCQYGTAQVFKPLTETSTAYGFFGLAGISGNYTQAKLSELAVYNPYSNLDVDYVEGYMANKYGITLKSDHPFSSSPPASSPSYAAGGLLRVNLNGGM